MKIHTIGHSNQQLEEFLAALREAGITLLGDVRSSPYSRFPWFGKNELRRALAQMGIEYLALGEALGGRPRGSDFYLPDGALNLERVRAGTSYQAGLRRVLEMAGDARRAVCLMCAEEDPGRCHRGRLITPDLEAAGVKVDHLRRRKAPAPPRRREPQQQELPWKDGC